ncbi:hypothetical protein CROQUDRAFT_45430 [Cronartium quercuum f. sp. fusiforme G11]|uniref:AB hydrolase-1 domain-containing protein n=1 Tax=Cronartium quercuum f. sp. fusiforme G11 TaxID=708437 RepID=A0A9P6NGU0_9BASI|nr:hypothetical protein CROQUDRAFT_45430 [Cronartium quercuum f. sp. fusiforme G11]
MPILKLLPSTNLYYEITFQDPLTKETKKTDSPTDCPLLKPWLLVIHPGYGDLTDVKSITDDEEYLERFNIIAFDGRDHGRTECPISPSRDYNSMSADLAFAMQKLGLPPVNVLASHIWATDIAIRLAALFPEKVLSLFLCGLFPDSYSPATLAALRECLKCLTEPETVEDWDEVRIGALHSFFFGGVPTDGRFLIAIDEWTGTILRRYPPSQAVRIVDLWLPILGIKPDPVALKESVVAPTMILHGHKSTILSTAQAIDRFSGYTNVGKGSKLVVIDGNGCTTDAPMCFLPTHAHIINQQFFSWVQPHLEHQAQSPPIQTQSVFQESLLKLARIYDDPEIGQRDPCFSESFHAITSSDLSDAKAMLDKHKIQQSTKFSLFGGGAPESWTGASLEERLPWR